MIAGIVLLLIVSIFIYFGFLQRILDNLYLNDRNAFLIILLLILGSFVDITLNKAPVISINIGGAVIPIILAIYVFIKADTKKEKIRSIASVILTSGIIYLASTVLQDFSLPRNDFIDSSLLYAIIAGVFAYAFGRSRRAAFIASIGGVLIYNIVTATRIIRLGQPTSIRLGGAGVFDSFVISSFLALGLTEIYGEIVEGLVRRNEGNKKQVSGQENYLTNNEMEKADDDER